MKHRVINRDSIIEAWVSEPEEDDMHPFCDPHGWQVTIETVREYRITIDMESEADCINFINSLGFISINKSDKTE